MTVTSVQQTGNLTTQDLEMFRRLGIDAELLEAAGVERLSDHEARELCSHSSNRERNYAGINYPYYDPRTGHRWTDRLRRDAPEYRDDRPRNKYLSAYGNRKRPYFPPGSAELMSDTSVPLVLVESEKASLALTAWSRRTGTKILALALGGCWGWWCAIGKHTTANGKTVDEMGPLPDLMAIVTKRRRVYVLMDANAATNPAVQQARSALRRHLRKQKADVRILDLPEVSGVNGPDDLVAERGDNAITAVLEGPEADWKSRLVRKLPTKKQADDNLPGFPMALLENALVAFREAPEWRDVLAFDEFSLHAVTREAAPWPESRPGANWAGCDDSMAAGWLQRNGIYVSSAVAAEAVETVARENGFHPVRDYLESLVWDKGARIDEWLITCMGAKGTAFVRAIGARWLISAVARIYEPGCQCDHTLMLEGEQGLHKSTALRILASDPWFVDHTSELGSKDSRLELNGRWIVEMSELDRVRRGALEQVKAFLVTRIDHIRPPYGRRTEDIPRSNVFAASTNSETPFVDETGNRRFWPVACGTIELGKLADDRDQLWAEAYHRYRAGAIWWLDTAELEKAAAEEQNERYDPGVWDQVILEWVNDPKQRPVPDGAPGEMLKSFDSTRNEVTVTDVLIHAVGKSLDRCSHGDRLQVVKCLVHEKWKRRQKGTGQLKRWFYFRTEGFKRE
jgi:predicted P-loop ATPase